MTLLITLAMLQALVYFPIGLVNLLHLPTWLAIALGAALFSWLLGEPWDEPF
ncbi:MAG: hypothetical protein Fur0046_06160 [Cyanobacteria bacterium J069]